MLAGFCLLASSAWAAEISEPRNIVESKRELNYYVDSGAYDAGIASAAAAATDWVKQRAGKRQSGERLAMVVDIDETALSNMPYMRRLDWGYESTTWKAWLIDATCPAIVPVKDLCSTAADLGIAIFFLTSRTEGSRSGTEKNLAQAGFGRITRIYFKPDGSKEPPVRFKTAWRKTLADEGFVIIANVGDQTSDLEGGFSEKTFKLPNPFYITK